MYPIENLEQAEKVAINNTKREAMHLYLLNKIVEALHDNTDQANDTAIEKLNSLSDGFMGIVLELRDIRKSLDDITHELKELNRTHTDSEEDLACIYENIGLVAETIAREGGDKNERSI